MKARRRRAVWMSGLAGALAVVFLGSAADGAAGPRGGLAELVARRWPNVEVRPDLPYAGTDEPRQRLDLYLPKRRAVEGPLPVVVFIHGGAWRAGDKRSGAWRVAPLVETGRFAGASIGYRLTGLAGWPAQLHDCKAAVRWLKAHAKAYGLDPERIAVWGSSAGGHLAALLGVTGDVPALEGTLGPHTDQTSRVACVVDWFGPTDLPHMNDVPGAMNHQGPDSPESRLLGGPIRQRLQKAREASPITYVSPGDAPHLIMHGDRDRVVIYDQSVRYAAALKKAGVPCVFVTVQGAGHGRFRNPEVEKRVRLFLEKFLWGRPVEVPETPIPAGP